MKIKGSTIIIVFMYVTWIAYLGLQIYVKTLTNSYLPSEVTYGTAALFIVETVSLARLKMAKEGTDIGAKQTNSFLSKIGLGTIESFEDEAQKENQTNKGNANGRTDTDIRGNHAATISNDVH